jgi:asparagine synthase (glutamine-hydrolysing)
MCGIAGYIGKQTPSDDQVNRCLELMRRRGPDARGMYRQSFGDGLQVVLLHSRLSIIDLDERSNQPFQLENDVLVYNGEIYNYLEVRDSLESRALFETTGDTEVLLRALQAMGTAALDRCEGMWAFAWFNEVRGELLLSRDRFGEKPLYLLQDDGGLYFGSEVKFIAALLGRSLTPNRNQLCRYLVNGYKALYKTDES